MDELSFGMCLVDIALQLVHRQHIADAHRLTLVAERRLSACPHDIVDGQFIAKDYFTILVHIDDSNQAGIVKSEEIEHRGVLTEAIGIVGIVHAYLIIAKEEQQAALHVALQLGTTADIGFFLNICHIRLLSYVY